MQTVFDWLSLAIFAGLAVLFLQRSVEGESVAAMWKYLPPALLCAVGNQVGNHGNGLIATVMFAAAVAYIIFVLKPLNWKH